VLGGEGGKQNIESLKLKAEMGQHNAFTGFNFILAALRLGVLLILTQSRQGAKLGLNEESKPIT
jgi:hypothetical protein